MQLNIQSVKECELRQNGKQMEVRPHYITRWNQSCIPVACTMCCNLDKCSFEQLSLKITKPDWHTTNAFPEVFHMLVIDRHITSQTLCGVCCSNRRNQRDVSSWTDEQTPCSPAGRGAEKQSTQIQYRWFFWKVESLILRLASKFPGRRDQLLFLINNYDVVSQRYQIPW